jgi:hypothetical protein
MATEEIGGRQFTGHPLLAGVHELGGGNDRPDLGDVPGFDGIAEDDSHGRFLQEPLENRNPGTGRLSLGSVPAACRGRFSGFN